MFIAFQDKYYIKHIPQELKKNNIDPKNPTQGEKLTAKLMVSEFLSTRYRPRSGEGNVFYRRVSFCFTRECRECGCGIERCMEKKGVSAWGGIEGVLAQGSCLARRGACPSGCLHSCYLAFYYKELYLGRKINRSKTRFSMS